MEKERYLKTDFRRLLKISSVSGDSGVAVSFIFSLENYAFEKGMVNFNVMDTYIYAVEMSGKTVLFKTICGFLSCDEGTVSVNGKVMGKDKDMLTEAGIIIEDPGSYETGVLTITLNFCTRYEIDR